MGARFAAAMKPWAVAAVAPPGVMTILLVLAVDAICGDATDCSWGFELLLVVPVVLVCWFVVGPLMVAASMRVLDRAKGRRAGVLTLLAAPFALWFTAAMFTYGMAGLVLGLVVVSVVVPAFVAALTG